MRPIVVIAAGAIVVAGAIASPLLLDSVGTGDRADAAGLAGSSLSFADAKTYANCTALNKKYPHGVGKPGAHDHVKGSTKPVTNFTVSSSLYKANKKSDRDGDGVACEKR
jgi:hypothetical protein